MFSNNINMNRSKLKLWHKIVLGILIFLALILFAIPRIGKSYIHSHSTELIGRKVDIGKIRLNYFSGAIRVKDLLLYEKDGITGFASFKSLKLDVRYWPFIKNEIVVDEIKLENFFCRVEQDGELFNFSDLIEESDSLESEVADVDTISSEPVPVTINNISIINSNLSYTDLVIENTVSLDDLDLFIPGITIGHGNTSLSLDFELTTGGRFKSSMGFNQTDSSYNFNLQLDSINLEIIAPYLKSSMDISAFSGFYSNNIQLSGNLQHIMDIKMKGWNRIDGLRLADNQEREIFSFEQFLIDMDTLLLEQQMVRLKEITLSSPFILFELLDSTNNWLALMETTDTIIADTVAMSEDTATTPTGDTAIRFSLASVNLENGHILFNDLTLRQPFTASIDHIRLKSEDIKDDSKEVSMHLSAGINQSAEINSDIVLDLTDLERMGVDLSLQKFAMKDISPYMEHYFGYPVESGFLNFETKNTLTSNSVRSNNNLYVRKFILGDPDKKEAEYKLPLKLALGILSDREGVIEMNIPVKSEGEKTSIGNLGKIIFRTIGNLIVKAATSPVDILAEMYGVDPGKINEMKIGLLENMPEKEEMATLDLVADILNDKPQLKAELAYQLDRAIFYDTLAMLTSLNDFKKNENYSGKSVPDSLLINYLNRQLNPAGTAVLRDLCKLYAGQVFLDQQLDSTISKHTDFVRDYLHSYKSLPESRFAVIMPGSDVFNTGESYGRFIIRFTAMEADRE